jgi:hypothetical protein
VLWLCSYGNVVSNYAILRVPCLSTKLQLPETLQFVYIKRPPVEEDVNLVDEANAMQAGMKKKTLALRKKIGKLSVVAYPELGDHFLASGDY